MNERCAIYTRLSHGDGESLDRQEADCRSYADSKGWEVVRVYREPDRSGYRIVDRPQYEAMLKAAKQGEFDVILVWRGDRLGRAVRETERILDTGASVASVHDGFDTSTATGKLIFRIALTLAQYESEVMALRIQSAKAASAIRGDKPHGAGRVFGFNEDWTETVEKEAEALREVVHGLLQGRSLRSLSRSLEKQGFRPTGGNGWTAQGLRAILSSPRIWGARTHRGEVVAEDAFPAIIDRGTWELVQSLLADPGRSTGPTGEASLLAGLVRCGRCGAKMRRLKEKYACRPAPDGCNGVTIVAEPLDKFVSSVAVVFADALHDTKVPDQEQELEDLRAKRRDLVRLFTQGSIDSDSLEEALQELNPRITRLEMAVRVWTTDLPRGTRGFVRSAVQAVFVASVGRGRKMPPEDRVVIVGHEHEMPELPFTYPIPEDFTLRRRRD